VALLEAKYSIALMGKLLFYLDELRELLLVRFSAGIFKAIVQQRGKFRTLI